MSPVRDDFRRVDDWRPCDDCKVVQAQTKLQVQDLDFNRTTVCKDRVWCLRQLLLNQQNEGSNHETR